ncbi:MAG TPA: aromatic/alkene/methane monooxygenase hydroxylase/oxygenase subunit alpha [Acidiphilium sp.]|jgi:propane monooxygenase large subunit|uniref:aromatic/alkene/methane monooxygenase hydroxylase/oxygenase subunit alpha n=1 Tax=unclassified Acidiphilium TaxID=2617493 RepID=UPI000BD6272D|nr:MULTISPECIES: aromatic/alkene/methane monooxygenase hydroxylase/oxygenase subunit alpha [unclassified Acidiphilium]OYV56796.1 MAG: methane monooxygenase [Acidiphilium sp. 20-67-58]OYV87623.1 MAG: methane monooxygenase [Acidiphilium sp. 21-68-69]HQT60396.1 aromatic/alkene/methane monooxygenase hydroxylase/oxygenase subunit alpha [Acidiphilium sp.]HQU10041.1 aromatic/alkene/methane monooxygenase hydroxylase/oxygenase subunit alpha [Acidiphilium sp.]
MTSLTLNKITSQRGISVGEATRKISDLGWNPTYVQEAMTYPTDYKITKAPRDPMKQVLRSYFPMQEEKDNRVYGALDAALRGDMFRNVEPRWVEWMKLFLAIIPFPEISAARSMAMVARLAPGEDLRTGFTMQMVDEFRHSTIQMNLKKWYMENYIDPAGFDITEEAFGKCYATTIGRQFGEGFITGDTMTAACMYLTVVAETAFTNTLFVAMPSEAARNGDYALPTVFLSVQSDESRHIGNGHSMLMAALKEPENHLLLERDLRYAFWQNHAIVDAAIGTFIEYGTTNRDKSKESYAEMWHRWIFEDYYRTYMLPLEKYGIKVHHDDVQAAWKRLTEKLYVHHVAQFFAVGWPVNFWRIEAQREADFEWFEQKYPGWYAKFGDFWKWYDKLSHRGEKVITFNEDVGYVYPHRCWSCLVPCLIREDIVVDEIDGKLHTFAHELDRWTAVEAFADEYQGRPTPAMGRFSGKREWETVYHGWDLADAIKDLNFVRSDGKTLVPQPHLRFDDSELWTLDDVRGHTLLSPLTLLREMSPEDRAKHIAEYRAGFTITPFN